MKEMHDLVEVEKKEQTYLTKAEFYTWLIFGSIGFVLGLVAGKLLFF